MKPNVCHFAAVILVAVLIATGCETTSQPIGRSSVGQEARATSVAPAAAQVETVSIPYDPALPKFAVVIKPFDYSASGQISGGGQSAPMANQIVEGDSVTSIEGDTVRTTVSATAGPGIGAGIAAQLRSALSGWANISILPSEAVAKKSDGSYACKLQPGEIGPFVIEGTVTEFTETADTSGKGSGFNSRPIGWATAIGGALGGNRVVTGVGAGVGLLGPKWKNAKMQRTGMVGMDLGIVDGRIARYIGGGTFKCQGSFTTVAAASNVSVLGISSGKGEAAASSLGNATRAALNDALLKVHDALVKVK